MGYSAYRMRPVHGVARTLDGAFVGGAYHLDASWSLEGVLTLHEGTEADVVHLKQWMVLAGPRYTLPISDRWSGFAHLLLGRADLRGSSGALSDRSVSFVCGPGIGVNVAITPILSLRGQGDYSITRYVDETQKNLAFSLGVVIRK